MQPASLAQQLVLTQGIHKVDMPWSLENCLLSTVSQYLPLTPSHERNFSPIIPVHDSSKYDPRYATLPSLRDTGADSGNLR